MPLGRKRSSRDRGNDAGTRGGSGVCEEDRLCPLVYNREVDPTLEVSGSRRSHRVGGWEWWIHGRPNIRVVSVGHLLIYPLNYLLSYTPTVDINDLRRWVVRELPSWDHRVVKPSRWGTRSYVATLNLKVYTAHTPEVRTDRSGQGSGSGSSRLLDWFRLASLRFPSFNASINRKMS